MAIGLAAWLRSSLLILSLFIIVAFAAWWRGHTVAPAIQKAFGTAPWPVVRGSIEPLDCDEAAYGYMGRRLLEGDLLYQDLSENKPPLGYWLYATAEAIGGPSELTIRLMPIAFVLPTVALIWWIGLRLGGPLSAVLGGLLYAILSCDPFIYGNGSQLNLQVNLFATASLAAFIASRESTDAQRLWLVLSGMMIGLATLVKQISVIYLVILIPALLIPTSQAQENRSRWQRLKLISIHLLGFLGPIGLTGILLALQGNLWVAVDDIVTFGKALATDLEPGPDNQPTPLRWLTGRADPNGELPPPFGTTDYVVWWAKGSWPIWLIMPGVLIWLLVSQPRAERSLIVAWLGCSLIQVILPGLYWVHYYLLLGPAAALGIGLTVGDLGQSLIRRGIRLTNLVPGIFLIAGIGGLVFLQTTSYLLVPSEELTIRHKGGRQWVAYRNLAEEIKARTQTLDDPELLVWGWQSPLLFYSGLDAPSRHHFTNDLMREHATDPNHPVVGPRVRELLKDLDQRRPELVLAGYEPFPALHDWLKAHYRPSQLVGFAPDGRGLWVRQDYWSAFEAAER